MHNVQVTPLIGLPQFNGWSQVVVNHDLTVTVALSVGGQNAGNIGRDLVAQIKETSPTSVEAFYRLLQDLKLDTEELGVVLALSAAYVTETEISYATLRGTVILKRGDKVGKVLSSDDQLQLIQGKTQVDDIVVLTTQAATSFLGEIQQKATQGYAPDVIIKSLAPGIHKEPDTATLSIGFMVFEPETEVAPETLPGSEVAVDQEIEFERERDQIVAEQERAAEPIATQTPYFESSQPSSEFHSSMPDLEPQRPTTPIEPKIETPLPPRKPRPPQKPLGERLVPVWAVIKKISGWLWRGLVALITKLIKATKRRPVPPLRLPAHAGDGLKPLRVDPSDYQLPNTKPFKTQLRSPFGHSPAVYLASGRVLAQRRLVIVIVLLAVCLVGGVVLWRQRQAQQVQAAQADLAPLLSEFTTAQNQVEADPVAARTKMQETLNQIEQLKKKYERQGAAQDEIDSQLAEARATYDSLSGQEELTALNVFFDLAQVQPGFLATKVASDGQNLVAIDQEKKEVLQLGLVDKAPKLSTIADLPTPTSLNLTNTSLLLLGGGVRQLDISEDPPSLTTVIPEGDSNREGTLVSRFNDFIYVLNPAKRNIFRYLVQDGDVSEPVGWVKPGQPLAYETMSSFKIDGDVWLGTTDGQIIKFTSGDRQEFAITGLAKPFTTAITLDTRENVNNVYVLEPAAKRVVILSKTGQFLKEISSPSLATASDIVADEARGLVLAISGSLIFEMQI